MSSTSPNNDLDSVVRDVQSMHLIDMQTSGQYNPLVYDHLTLLLKPKLVSGNNNVDTLNLSFRTYVGLEEYSLEHNEEIEFSEAQDIDWNFIDEAKGIFTESVGKVLKKEGRPSDMKTLVKFSADLFENYHIYKQQYPDSKLNPWIPAYKVLKSGYLLLLSDNRDVLDRYNKGVFKPQDENNNLTKLGVLANSAKSARTSGFMVDKRHSIQGLVYEFLKLEACGSHNAKSTKKITEFLWEQKQDHYVSPLKGKILIPLKRAGLVGSNSQGYYTLNSKQDFIDTYRSHMDKIDGINRTMQMFCQRYTSLGHGDLKDDASY